MREQLSLLNRWLRFAVILVVVAAAFAGARVIALGVLFVGFAVWAVRRWRDRKRGLAFALVVALAVGAGLYGFASYEVWKMRAWRATHFSDILRLAADGTYEFLFVAPPLPITGAVGSPINPQAIK